MIPSGILRYKTFEILYCHDCTFEWNDKYNASYITITMWIINLNLEWKHCTEILMVKTLPKEFPATHGWEPTCIYPLLSKVFSLL